MTPPSQQQLAMLRDQELVDLAIIWRKQAARGLQPAFGMAHALEVECRRRARDRGEQLQQAQALHEPDPQRWWIRCWMLIRPTKKDSALNAESLAAS